MKPLKIYEIKSSAVDNAEVLWSDDKSFFYWDIKSFKDNSHGDPVILVNKSKGYVCLLLIDKKGIKTDYNEQEDKSVFSDEGKQFEVDGSYFEFVRFKVLKRTDNEKLKKWESVGMSPTYDLWKEEWHRKLPSDVEKRLERIKGWKNLLPEDSEIVQKLESAKLLLEGNSHEYDHISPVDEENMFKTTVQKRTDENSVLNIIYKYIRSKGFYFSEEDIINFYLSLKAKPFVILAGISGTGKTKLADLFGEAIGATVRLIPVRPDWADNSDLIGYTDLKNQFRPKELALLLKEARVNPERIYFAILDEMNLARVEHYFSDFLSVIESRRWEFDEQKDKIVTKPIIKWSDLGEQYTETASNNGGWHEMGIPDNFYLIGTVNMDETTHPFSRKVLDRANAIEMNTVDLSWKTERIIVPKLKEQTNDFLKSSYLTSNDLSEEELTETGSFIKKLIEINNILEEADLHVGYRVRDEIAFYLLENKRMGSPLKEHEVYDFQIMQKILPRVQGSSQRVETVLFKLYGFLVEGNVELSAKLKNYDSQNMSFEEDFDQLEKDLKSILENKVSGRYPLSKRKICFMLRRLREDGFTSFWQ